MEKSRIYLSLPHISKKEQKHLLKVFLDNGISLKGSNINSFEEDLEEYLGKEIYVGALNSGTAAIHLGLILLGVQAGDEVICQSMTFAASANPIIYLGATPVFVDSELETWNICPAELEKAIVDRISKGKKPKAIIAVHLYGVPYKVDEVRTIADKYEIPILEDAAEALGSTYKGQKCGTFGDIGVFSFNGNKIITTSGGGAIITKNRQLKDKALFLATQARDNAPHYQHSEIGYNYRMSTICAGIGRGQMEVLEERVELRREIHEFYVNLFKYISDVCVNKVPNEDYYANYWLSAIIIEPKLTNAINREVVRLAFENKNIESRPLWKPLHLQPIFEKYPYYGNNIAETLFENGLCLPSSSNLTEEERKRITVAVSQVFK